MRALVTGAGGFVGSHLAARLVADGWDVTGTVRPQSGAERLQTLGVGAAVRVVTADLADRDANHRLAQAADADVVFLAAAARAAATQDERAATVAVNAASAQWLIDGLTPRCRVVVRLGSSTEYGAAVGPMDEQSPLRPRGFFGATKAAGSVLTSAACAAAGVRAAVLRPFQVYGPLDHAHRLVPTTLHAARTGCALPLTTGNRRRDWIFVDDVVEACIRAATGDHLPSGQVLNLGTGRQFANEELVSVAESVTGRRIDVRAGQHPGCSWDTGSWVCDPRLAGELLGWEAKVPLTDGLRRCWEAEWA